MSAIRPVDSERDLIGVFELARLTGVPRATLYWLTDKGKIPAVDVTQDWHERRRLRYRLADVQAALAELGRTNRERRAARAS
jgi:excisionase family DNA binding protein